MRHYLKKTLLFTLVFFILLLIFLLIINLVVNKNATFKLNRDCKFVVLGHSHPECAFNDSLIDNFINLSQSGESYFYTYQKVKQILLQNPQIEVVFIEFTNNQIDKVMDSWIWGDENISYRYPTYSPFININENLLLLTKNPSSYLNALSLSGKKNINLIFKNNYNFTSKIGGYLYLKRDKTDSLINLIKYPTNTKLNTNINLSNKNIEYLNKIINFCKKENRQVYLIRSPQHKYYKGLKNENVYKTILETNFKNIEYLDFCNFPLKNSQFGDLEHLNYKGAKVFSNWFDSLLKDSLLHKKNKQLFINTKMIELE